MIDAHANLVQVVKAFKDLPVHRDAVIKGDILSIAYLFRQCDGSQAYGVFTDYTRNGRKFTNQSIETMSNRLLPKVNALYDAETKWVN